jgi:alkanesulfonate monooxygenase SsuD/methylene tetrahydromethanopterin reductase-like flavin-dependent oxidoreductase (luciferase family)
MKFGQFYLLETPPGKDHAVVYHEAFEQFRLLDETGWDAIWLAEHHFDHRVPEANYYSITPSIHTMAAYAAAITERIKIGTAVVVLPFHHPVIVAEDFATVDIMSKGRLLLGVGRGYQFEEYYNWGLDLDESRDRFQESLEIILKAWTGPFEHEGQFHQIRPVNVLPKPVQTPHPPIYVAAVSPSTYEWVIKNGYNVLTSFLDPYPKVFEAYEQYHKVAEEAGLSGKLDFPLARFLYVAKTTAQAREECRESLLWYFRTLLASLIAPPADIAPPDQDEGFYRDLQEKFRTISYEQILEDHAVIGDPDYVTERLKWIEANTGTQHFIGWTRMGKLAPELVCKSLRMFSDTVMPQFKETSV